MFDFERPNIEVAEISEDKNMEDSLLNLWKEVMVLPLAIL